MAPPKRVLRFADDKQKSSGDGDSAQFLGFEKDAASTSHGGGGKVDAYIASLSEKEKTEMTPSKILHLCELIDVSDEDKISLADDEEKDASALASGLDNASDSGHSGVDAPRGDGDEHVATRKRKRATGRGRGRGKGKGKGKGRGRGRGRGKRRRIRDEDSEVSSDSDGSEAPRDDDDDDASDSLANPADGWDYDDAPADEIPFTATPGMTIPNPLSPLGFIQLFITRELLTLFSEETHNYAVYCRDDLHLDRARSWPGCTIVDIAHYIGLVMLMGINRLPAMRMHWIPSEFFATTVFLQTMTYRRFVELGRFFHAYDRRCVPENNTDRLIWVRPVMQYLQERFRKFYTPHKELSLDEGVLPYKGRLSFKTYNPNKPDKYGIKLYILCESNSGYVLDFSVYRGVSATLRNIVFGLLGNLIHKGYHVFMDNFYNSVALSEELYENGVHCTGTLRLARGAPPQLRELGGRRQPRDSFRFMHKCNTIIMCWYDTRLVSMITNKYGTEREEYVHRKRVRVQGGRTELQTVSLQRPVAISEYNKHMAGVDRFDQLIKYYSFLRRTVKWSKKMTFYLLQMALQNAYALYSKYTTDTKKLSHLQFQMVAIQSLIYFDIDEWPVQGSPIRRPGTERRPQTPPPAATPASPSAPSAATPASTPATPVPVTTEASEDVDDPVPAAVQRRPRYIDPPERLTPSVQHRPVPVGDKIGQQKRCRVCAMNKKRRDTTKMCAVCKVPLCVRGECFVQYHTRRKYWSTPPAGGRGTTPQAQH